MLKELEKLLKDIRELKKQLQSSQNNISKLSLIFLLLGIFIVQGVWAVETGDAGFAGAFLRSGIGARAVGMGGAFSAVEGDSTSIYWNPAGIACLKRGEANFMQGNLSLDRKYNYLAVAKPVKGERYTLGLGYLQEKIDGIENRDNSGNLLGYFDNTDKAYYFSGGWKVNDKLKIGGNIKYIDKSLFQSSASAWGLDLGLLYEATDRLNVGVTVKNLGATLDWSNTPTSPEEDIPESATLGLAYKIFSNATLAMDIKKVRHFDAQFFAGIETVLRNVVALRLGSYDGELTFGVGINYKDFTFDYAYQDENLGGDTHRLATTWRFGQIVNPFHKKKKKKSLSKVVLKESSSNSGDFTVQINKGISYFEKEEYVKALKVFKGILEKSPQNADALYYVGNCLVALGNKTLAKKYYAKALKIAPKHKFAMYAKMYLN